MSSNTPTTQKCRECKRVLPLSSFYSHPQMRYGVDSKCKECKQSELKERQERGVDPTETEKLSKQRYADRIRAVPLSDRPSVTMLTCGECAETKNVQSFAIDLSFKSGYTSKCRKCIRANARKRYAATPSVRGGMKTAREKYRNSPHGKLKELDYVFRTKFGITAEDYFAMLEAQGGNCALCLTPPIGKYRLAVDHDHKTGKVRGLLCIKCNSALERFDSCENFLERVAAYLASPPFEQLSITVDQLASEAVN